MMKKLKDLVKYINTKARRESKISSRDFSDCVQNMIDHDQMVREALHRLSPTELKLRETSFQKDSNSNDIYHYFDEIDDAQ